MVGLTSEEGRVAGEEQCCLQGHTRDGYLSPGETAAVQYWDGGEFQGQTTQPAVARTGVHPRTRHQSHALDAVHPL